MKINGFQHRLADRFKNQPESRSSETLIFRFFGIFRSSRRNSARTLILTFVSALLLTASFVVFSAPFFAQGEGELLRRHGFVKGDDKGHLMEDQKLTREQLAVLLCELYGRGIEASRFKRPPDYADAYLFPAWSRNYISYAQYMGWMIGTESKFFYNKGFVSDRVLAQALIRVLGYSVENMDESLKLFRTLGIRIPKTSALTRAQAFEVLWRVVTKPVMKGGKILGEEIGRLSEDTDAFRLLNIRSDNFGYVVATFNKNVDPISVSKDSMLLTDVNTGRRIEIAAVKVFKKSVYFIPSAPLKKTVAECRLQGVNSDWGESDRMKDTAQRVVIDDTAHPNFVGFEFSGEREITLIFDEPISKIGDVKLKMGNINISVSHIGVTGIGTDRLTFKVHSNLQEGKSYAVEPRLFKDLVGKSNTVSSKEEIFYKHTNAPTLQIGEQKTGYVELIFSSPVKGLEESKFYHTSPEKRPIKITAAANFQSAPISSNDYVNRAYLWFYDSSSDRNYPLSNKGTLFYVDERGITDGFNEQLKQSTYTVKASDEEVFPKVEAVEFMSPQILKIKFSANVSSPSVTVRTNGGEVLDYKVSKKVGSNGGGSENGSNASSGRELTLTFLKHVVSESIEVKITSEKDRLVSHSVTIRIDDNVAPEVVGVRRRSVRGEFALVVDFSESLDDSALLVSNYQIVNGGTLNPIAGKAKFEREKRTVVISLPERDYKEIVSSGRELYISGVKDLAGNVMTGVRVKIRESE